MLHFIIYNIVVFDNIYVRWWWGYIVTSYLYQERSVAWILCWCGVSQCYVSKVAPINYISSPPSISAPKDCQGLSVNRDFKNTDNTSSLLFVKVAREC